MCVFVSLSECEHACVCVFVRVCVYVCLRMLVFLWGQ